MATRKTTKTKPAGKAANKRKVRRSPLVDQLDRLSSLLTRAIPLVSTVRWLHQRGGSPMEQDIAMTCRRAEEGLTEAHRIIWSLQGRGEVRRG